MAARVQKREEKIEEKYKTKIKYYCKKRGWVEEEVEVTRYTAKEVEESAFGYSLFDDDVKDESVVEKIEE